MAKETPRSSSSGELNALLGKGSEFEGKLVFEGTVRVDGRFKGEIISEGTLMLGDNAQFEGEIRVGRAVISGEVKGDVKAKTRLELHAPARITGNIVTSSLVVQEGVLFDGNCHMTKEAGSRERPAVTSPAVTAPAATADDEKTEQDE